MIDHQKMRSICNPTATNESEERYNCPFCTDARERMYVKRSNEVFYFHCKNCGKKGRYKLGGLLTSTSVIDKYKHWLAGECKSKGGEIKLPSDFSQSTIPTKGLIWLYKYGITDEQIQKYGIGYSEKYGRIILPVYRDGELIYYQARTLNAVSKDNPKYINLKNSDAKNVYLLTGNTEDKSCVCIVEDILSAIRVGETISSLSLLGSYIAPQIGVLLSAYQTVFMWLDADKYREALAYARELHNKYGVCVKNITTSKDPKEYTTAEIRKILLKE